MGEIIIPFHTIDISKLCQKSVTFTNKHFLMSKQEAQL